MNHLPEVCKRTGQWILSGDVGILSFVALLKLKQRFSHEWAKQETQIKSKVKNAKRRQDCFFWVA